MRKIIFLLSALLLVGGVANAQKKNLSKAKACFLGDPQDLRGAKDAIVPAMADSLTKKDASTWFYGGEIFSALYNDYLKQEFVSKKKDKGEQKATSIYSALQYYIVADSLDQQPNAKGKIPAKYRKQIVEKVKSIQKAFLEGGSFYYDQKDYKNALKFFDTYVSYPEIAFLKGQGLEKDTIRPSIIYYCGLCATQAEMPSVAVKYYEQIKDDNVDSKWIYARLCEDYSNLKDTANMIRMYKLGVRKFPQENFYVRSLINYYITQSKLKDAMEFVNQALAQDSKTAILWNLKGRILEQDSMEVAKTCYNKAIELDPEYADPIGNLGRIIYNKAVEELTRVNAIRDDKKYRAEKVKVRPMFEAALPYFEKAYALNPKESDYITGLVGIYYNLGMEAKYMEMNKKLKELKNN
jgi:tetratricopeptide (TPR) repeat protein